MSDIYKVIEILNEKELIINYGARRGADVGDNIRIYEVGEDVIDKDTGESLGTLDMIKADLEIYTVFENFSICRDVSRSTYSAFNVVSGLQTTSTSFNKLNISEDDISNRWPIKISKIKVGDFVKVL